MSRQDQYNVTVTLDGQSLGTFDKMTGGDMDSDQLTYRPGNMGRQISLGGTVTVNDITVSRLYVLERDHALFTTLKNRVGKGAVTLNRQVLDVEGNAFGRPIIYTGSLKGLQLPEIDSESSDPGLLVLVVSPDGEIG